MALSPRDRRIITTPEQELADSNHAEREESEAFRALVSARAEQERRDLGEKLRKAERSAPTHAHPAAAGSPLAQRVIGPFAALLDEARHRYKD